MIMKITIKVKTSAKVAKVEKISENEYRICVKAKPVEGKANEAVREALADHFGIARSRVALVSGQTSKIKTFEIA